jgi:predicted aspartyl protease
MIRYRYNRQVAPPAPFVNVTIRAPAPGAEASNRPAQLDTAAYRTVIPAFLAQELGLEPLDEISVTALGGHTIELLSYIIELQVHDFPPRRIEVVASDDEPHCLLGRDVLNGLRITLDGPNLSLVIG